MKKLYAEQIDEIQTAFRDRNNSLQTELSRYKEKSATFEEEMKERDEKLTKMKNLYNEQIDELQAAFREKKESDHEAEMERMKNIYESMLKEIQEAFQEKLKQLPILTQATSMQLLGRKMQSCRGRLTDSKHSLAVFLPTKADRGKNTIEYNGVNWDG